MTKWLTISVAPSYQVSDSGGVRRVTAYKQHPALHELKPSMKDGYHYVTLYQDEKPMYLRVHRLVAFAFLGAPPTEKHICCHDDGVRTNNLVGNLKWATNSENMKDRVAHGTVPKRNPLRSKLTVEKVQMLRSKCLETKEWKPSYAAEFFGVSRPTISGILNGSEWRGV
jgi:hypothetical protein